jgi:hypothetical protein
VAEDVVVEEEEDAVVVVVAARAYPLQLFYGLLWLNVLEQNAADVNHLTKALLSYIRVDCHDTSVLQFPYFTTRDL